MSRFSLVWISAKEQLTLERVIKKILQQVRLTFECYESSNNSNKNVGDPEHPGGRLEYFFTDEGWIIETLGTTKRELLKIVIPEGVKLNELTEYIYERLHQFCIVSPLLQIQGYNHCIECSNCTIFFSWTKYTEKTN